MGATLEPRTVWHAGRFGASRGPHRLLFGEMYEDADIEVAAFRGKDRIFCIASSGATAIRLASDHDVVACDINPAQLAYAKRRANGGRPELGDAERAMIFVRHFMPLVGWQSEMVQAFLSLSNIHAQTAFWNTHLRTRRFQLAFDAVMSPPVLRTVYARQLVDVLPPHFGRVLRRRLERGFACHENASNPYPRMLFLGNVDTECRVAGTIEFVLGDAASVLESCPERSLGGFALSNILDGAHPSYSERLFQAVRRTARPDAMVVLRSFAEPSAVLSTNRAECDRSMLWGIVDVRGVHS